MYQDAPSKTAYRAALSRAVHQLHDFPPVFNDPIATQIVGQQAAQFIRENPKVAGGAMRRGLRAALVARSRIAEDCLHDEIRHGTRQYVILGAGLDTFPYRCPYDGSTLRMFEVDRPAAQQWKHAMLAAAGLAAPDNLAYVPVDFETDDLVSRLLESDVDPAIPTFFSWLGVTMYLEHAAVMTTLERIGSRFCRGSTVVFDYIAANSILRPSERLIRRLLQFRYWRMGEPWKTFIDPAELAASLQKMGYGSVANLSSDSIYSAHFANRKDALKFAPSGLSMTRIGGMITARI